MAHRNKVCRQLMALPALGPVPAATRPASCGECSLLSILALLLLASALTLGMVMWQGNSGGPQQESGATDPSRWENPADTEEGRRRMRRQTLPADNVLVYATNSNVSVTDRVQVLSAESHIRLLERHMNATVWSNASLLQMAPNGEQVALSASQAIALAMALSGGARIEGAGDTLQLNESSGALLRNSGAPSADDVDSRLEAELTGRRLNLSWVDAASGAITLRATNARLAALLVTGWTRPGMSEEMSVLSAPASQLAGGGAEQQELSIAANSPAYQVQIRLVGSETALLFRGARLDIPPHHRSLLLRALGWRVRVQSAVSPFELHASQGQLRVNCFEEALTLSVRPEELELHVGQMSRLSVNRSESAPSSVRLNGGNFSSAALTDRMELVSRVLRLSLSRGAQGEGQSVLIDATNSQLRLVHANRTTAMLTAVKHFVEMLGGQPRLELSAGNVSVQMEVMDGAEAGDLAELDTEIVPKELLQGLAQNADIFGIGPVPLTLVPTPATASGMTATTMGQQPSANGSTAAMAPATLRMAPPAELFSFHQTFPPPSTPGPRPATAVAPGGSPLINDPLSAAAFPSPDPQLFTFPPSSAPDAEFLVGQFETLEPPAQNAEDAAASEFPIMATISAMQMPEETADQLAQHFPGIRRENTLIWRPDEVPSESSGETRRASREVPSNGDAKERDRGGKMALEVDIALGAEEDLHLERVRRQLVAAMQRLLDEGDGASGKSKRDRQGAEAATHFRVANVELEQVGDGRRVDAQREAVRAHFSLANGGGEGEGGGGLAERERTLLERVNHEMDREQLGKALQHEVLSEARLVPEKHTSPLGRAPAMSAISSLSLPVLLLGSLSLSLALLAMLLFIGPLSNWLKGRARSVPMAAQR